MDNTQDISCPYCSRRLKGQTGLSVHISKSLPCRAAQERILARRIGHSSQSRPTHVLLFDQLFTLAI